MTNNQKNPNIKHFKTISTRLIQFKSILKHLWCQSTNETRFNVFLVCKNSQQEEKQPTSWHILLTHFNIKLQTTWAAFYVDIVVAANKTLAGGLWFVHFVTIYVFIYLFFAHDAPKSSGNIYIVNDKNLRKILVKRVWLITSHDWSKIIKKVLFGFGHTRLINVTQLHPANTLCL